MMQQCSKHRYCKWRWLFRAASAFVAL